MDKKKFPNKYLIFGVLLILFGAVLFLWTSGYIPGIEALWPIPGILIGLALLYLVFLKGASFKYVFPGMFITLAGFFLIIINTIIQVESLLRIWPIFMAIVGVSLLPYGFNKEAKNRETFIIPAISFIILASIFLPFSLKITNISFSEFVTLWWPILFIVLGIFFITIYYIRRR